MTPAYFFGLVTVASSVSFAVAFVLSALLPFGLRGVLERLGVIDVPNERSSHERPVLRGMGLAVLIALIFGALAGGTVLLRSENVAETGWQMLAVILIAALASGLLGFREDLRGVSVPVRSAITLAIALVSSLALLFVLHNSPISQLPFSVHLLLALYAMLFISSYINVANFMDGLNGISGFHGVIAGVTFWIAGLSSQLPWLSVTGAILAASFLGFLPWNLSQPGAFLGDVGSYLLGGAVAVTSFAAFIAGVPILATIGPMIIYFGDVGVTLVKRVRAGHKWHEPHKDHTYQRLQQLGLSHVQSSGVVAVFTVLASALGLCSYLVSPIWWIALTFGGLVLLGLYLLTPRIFGEKSRDSYL